MFSREEQDIEKQSAIPPSCPHSSPRTVQLPSASPTPALLKAHPRADILHELLAGLEMWVDAGRPRLISSMAFHFEEAVSSALRRHPHRSQRRYIQCINFLLIRVGCYRRLFY
jgi:hypothetical protein